MSVKEKTLAEFLFDLWLGRVYIAIAGIIGFVVALAWLATATPYYRASMIVSPANPMNGAEISSLLANDNLFALRYLVQRVGVANSSDFLRFENVYQGPSVAKLLLKDENIISGLRMDKAFPFSKAKEKWSAESLAEYVADHVRLEPVGATSLRRMVYNHPDREFASYFLTRIHGLSDKLIRRNIREETQERILYLKGAIKTTGNPEHRRALTSLLLEQERLRMMVSIEQPYAAAVVEPSASSVRPVWPDPYLLISGTVLVFAFSGFVIFSLRNEMAAPRRKAISMKKQGWIKGEGENTNRKPFSASDAAE